MVKLKQNLTTLSSKTLKLSRRNSIKLVVALIAVLLASGGLVWILQNTGSRNKPAQVDCAALSKTARDLLSQGNKQSAYEQLKPAAEQCGVVRDEAAKDPSRVQDYINTVEFNGDLAVAAFVAGDKDKAKQYAEQGIKLNESRTAEQSSKIPRDQIPELNKALSNMYDIQAGYYRYNPTQFSNDGEAQ